jgi:ribonuclease J
VFNGSVVATLVLKPDGRRVAPPAITLIGLVEPGGAEKAVPALRTAVERALDELPPAARRLDDAVVDAARRALRRALNERFGKRPLTEIQVVRV